ncbi:hypothetical protein BS78_01G207400 [Paspalum vaginatum]|nr:hypothetical protein BS78_01G207400 [Paspalum vaginatum]
MLRTCHMPTCVCSCREQERQASATLFLRGGQLGNRRQNTNVKAWWNQWGKDSSRPACLCCSPLWTLQLKPFGVHDRGHGTQQAYDAIIFKNHN